MVEVRAKPRYAPRPVERPISTNSDGIAGLQRLAGNRAVAGLSRTATPGRPARPAAPLRPRVEGTGRRPTSAARSVLRQYAGDVSARDNPGTHPVQRDLGDLADRATAAIGSAAAGVLPTGLLTALTSARQTADATESQARESGEQRAAEATRELEEAPRQLDEQVRTAGDAAARSASAQAAAGQQSSAAITGAGQQLAQTGAAASTQIASLGSIVGDLVSPAAAIVNPAAIAGAAGRLAGVSRSVAGAALAGPAPAAASAASAAPAAPAPAAATADVGSVVGASIGPAAAPRWNCDLASVVSAASGLQQGAVAAAVNLAESAIGAERVQQISAFGQSISQGIQQAGAQVRGTLTEVAQGARRRLADLGRGVIEPATAAAAVVGRGFHALTTQMSQGLAAARTGFLRRWSAITDGAGRAVATVTAGVRNGLTVAVGLAGRALGGLGSAARELLPGWATSFLDSVPARVDAAVSGLRAIGQRIADAASRAKDTALNLAKSFVNAKLQEWAALKQGVERMIKGAGDLARRAGRAVVDAIPQSVKAPVARLVAAVRTQAGRFLAAADSVGAKIRDGACVAFETVAGPCVTQHLPQLGGGLSNTVRLIATGDLTLPLEEIGIPANLKVGAGAAVAVTAQEGTYTVKLSGDATIFLNETLGGERHVEAGATGAPPQLTGSLAPAWLALTTGSPTAAGGPAAPAGAAGGPGVAAPAAAAGAIVPAGGGEAASTTSGGAVGAGRQIEVNAGVRGTSETEWRFQATRARTSCEGVGGLVTLLAGLGVAQALPAPFNQLGAAAVQRGFMDQLISSKFSVGLAGEVRADLTTEGVGKLRGRLGADVSENIQIVRDPLTGQLITTRFRTITGELDAAALGPFTAGGLERFGVYLEGQGILRLALAYEGDDIVPTSLGGAIKTTVGARNFEPTLIAGLFPPEVGAEVRRILAGAFPGMRGSREVALSLTIGRVYTGLEPLGRELNAYFRGPVELITVDGVLAIVKRTLAGVTAANHAKLEITATQRATLAAGATEGEGIAAGGNARVQAEHVIARTWYGFGGTDDVLEAAAARRRQAAAPVEPAPREPEEEPPPGADCVGGVPAPQGSFPVDKRHPLFPRCDWKDTRNKHTAHVTPVLGQPNCNSTFLASVTGRNRADLGPRLQLWFDALQARSNAYGGQLGEETFPDYEAIVKEAVDGRGILRGKEWFLDVGSVIGVDVATQTLTTKVRIKGAFQHEAHIIPFSGPMPT